LETKTATVMLFAQKFVPFPEPTRINSLH